MSTLGLGNALVDVLSRLESDGSLAEIGIEKGAMDMIDEPKMRIIQQTLSYLERTQAPGGSVCNTMRAMANLGANTGFIGKVGTDALGTHYEEAIREAGVTPHLTRTTGISGCCTVMISPDGERTMATFLGPAPTLTPDDISEETIAKYDYIYIEGYLLVNEPLVRSTMEKAKKHGVKIALDLSNFNIVNAFRSFLEDIIPNYVNILFSNETEAEAFTGATPQEAIGKLSQLVDISIVTLGKDGALIAGGGKTIHVPSEGKKPIDTTGAGDHFAAGFLYGQSAGGTLEQAGRIGSLLAGYAIEVVGAQIPPQHWEQIKLKVDGILQ